MIIANKSRCIIPNASSNYYIFTVKMDEIMHIGGELAMSLLFNFYHTSYTYIHGRMCAHFMCHA